MDAKTYILVGIIALQAAINVYLIVRDSKEAKMIKEITSNQNKITKLLKIFHGKLNSRDFINKN